MLKCKKKNLKNMLNMQMKKSKLMQEKYITMKITNGFRISLIQPVPNNKITVIIS